MTLLELTYQQSKARREAGEILDRAVLESRALTIAEQVRFDSLLARCKELEAAFDKRAALRTV